MGHNLITWAARKQRTVSRSLSEAEYRSVASCAIELCWFRLLFSELQVPLCKVLLRYDNLSTIALTKNVVLHARTKHIETDLYFVRDMVSLGFLQLQHIPGTEQVADLLTKPLS